MVTLSISPLSEMTAVGGDTDGVIANAEVQDWGRIEFQADSNDANSLIEYTVIRYSGKDRFDYGAIRLVNASPTISYTELTNNYRGIEAINGSTPTLVCNDIYNNTNFGIYNNTPATLVTAEGHWWGSPFGPTNADNPGGIGQAVSDGVEYRPWAGESCLDTDEFYVVAGRVTDNNNNLIAGVTVSDGAGHSSVTDSNGNYLFSGLVSGNYTITPAKDNLVFSPPSRSVSIPPNQTGQDFTTGQVTPTPTTPPPTVTPPPPTSTPRPPTSTPPTPPPTSTPPPPPTATPSAASTDIYFLFDLSASFADDLPVFKTISPGIMASLAAQNPNTNIRFGLGRFEDYPIAPFGSAAAGDKAYERIIDLTTNQEAVAAAIASLSTRDGGDIRESQLTALYQIATGAGQDLSGAGQPQASIGVGQQASFQQGATKVIFLWTDAPFHRPGDPGNIPYPGPSLAQTVAALKNLGKVKLLVLYSTPTLRSAAADQSSEVAVSATDALSDLRQIAIETGSVASERGVDCNGDDIIDIAAGQPLICPVDPAAEGLEEAIDSLVDDGIDPPQPQIFLPIVLND